MVPFSYRATQTPAFVLYGDNTVIFRPTSNGRGTGFPPLVKAVMSAAQVDALLTFALTQGHLAMARNSYALTNVTDLPTYYFTINAAGVSKVVGVYGLGQEDAAGQPNPDLADFKAFAQLNAVLSDFEREVRRGQVISAEVYEPTQYRAILIETPGADGATAWPWKDLKSSDLLVDPDNSSTRYAAIAPDQAGAVTTIPSGGMMAGRVSSSDGKTAFTLSIRPMLPGDKVIPESLAPLGF